MNNVVSQLAILLPMFAMGGSAVAFVWKQYLDRAERRNKEMFQLMSLFDEKGTLASKLAALYRLRDFEKDREFVARFCDAIVGNLEGTAANALREEIIATKKFVTGEE